MCFHIVILRLLFDVESLKLQPPAYLFFSYEDSERNLEVVVSNYHEERQKGMDDGQDTDDMLDIDIIWFDMDPFFNILVIVISCSIFLCFLILTFFVILRGNWRSSVEKQHDVYQEGYHEGNILHVEEIPRQKSNDFSAVRAQINIGEGRTFWFSFGFLLSNFHCCLLLCS